MKKCPECSQAKRQLKTARLQLERALLALKETEAYERWEENGMRGAPPKLWSEVLRLREMAGLQ